MAGIKNKRFLIAGCGSIGRRHLSNLKTLGVSDLILLDKSAERLKAAAEGLTRPLLVKTMDEALDAGPYCAVISVPTSLHLGFAGKAAARGVHLFIEKPLSHNMSGIEGLKNIAMKRDINVMMAMCYRFHPVLLRIKERLDSGIIGCVYHVNYFGGFYLPYWHRHEDYRVGYAARAELGGGVLLTSIHGLDTLRWLFGEALEVKALMAKVSPLEMDVEDLALAVMRFSSGAFVSWQTDFLQRAGQHRMVIVGEKGSMRFDINTGVEEICGADGGKWKREKIPFDINTMYVRELEHFILSLQRGVPAEPSLDEGVKTLRLAMMVFDSAMARPMMEELTA